MLEELHVENLLLIERAHLRLASGLNVLTGETGAGKTVLAHALDLLLGGRPRAGIVRPGAQEAYVEGVFHAGDGLIAGAPGGAPSAAVEGVLEGGEVVLARRVGADGRTRAYVNGRSAAVGDLRELGGALLAFYGQHEHRRLMLSAAQLEILDALCGEAQRATLRACAAAHTRVRGVQERLEDLRALACQGTRELELLEHELAEIEALGADLEDHERLLGARERLRRIDALLSAAGAAAVMLGSEPAGQQGSLGADTLSGEAQPGAAGLAARGAAALEALGGVDGALDGLAERARGIAVEAQELSSELRAYSEGVEAEALEVGGEGQGGIEALEAAPGSGRARAAQARRHGGGGARARAWRGCAARAAGRR